jgi:hypothetical protein
MPTGQVLLTISILFNDEGCPAIAAVFDVTE